MGSALSGCSVAHESPPISMDDVQFVHKTKSKKKKRRKKKKHNNNSSNGSVDTSANDDGDSRSVVHHHIYKDKLWCWSGSIGADGHDVVYTPMSFDNWSAIDPSNVYLLLHVYRRGSSQPRALPMDRVCILQSAMHNLMPNGFGAPQCSTQSASKKLESDVYVFCGVNSANALRVSVTLQAHLWKKKQLSSSAFYSLNTMPITWVIEMMSKSPPQLPSWIIESPFVRRLCGQQPVKPKVAEDENDTSRSIAPLEFPKTIDQEKKMFSTPRKTDVSVVKPPPSPPSEKSSENSKPAVVSLALGSLTNGALAAPSLQFKLKPPVENSDDSSSGAASDHRRLSGDNEEELNRRDQLELFSHKCTAVNEYLSVGGDGVASDRRLLRRHNITHVVNCAPNVCKNYFDGELKYLVVHLRDSPHEDLGSILYDVFAFVEACRESGGHVLIHCQKGVSRSCAISIAYLMHTQNKEYSEAFDVLHGLRSICCPNLGFIVQLKSWWKRRRGVRNTDDTLMFRVTPQQSKLNADWLVLKSVDVATASLDPRSVFVVWTTDRLYVWSGNEVRSPELFQNIANVFVDRIQRWENAPKSVVCVSQGDEPDVWSTIFDCSVPFTDIACRKRYDDDYPVQKPRLSKTISIGDLPPDSWAALELYTYPSFEQIDHFDSDDLDENGCFLLVMYPSNNDNTRVFVWCGPEFDFPDGWEEDKSDEFAEEAASDLAEVVDLGYYEVETATAGEESDLFWEGFEDG